MTDARSRVTRGSSILGSEAETDSSFYMPNRLTGVSPLFLIHACASARRPEPDHEWR